jgi:hypothetical protein
VSTASFVIFLGVAYAAIFPAMHFLDTSRAKTNTQANAVPLLYKLEREVRESDSNAMYYYDPVSSSAQPLPATMTDVATFAVASAKTGTDGAPCYPGGVFDTDPSGQPIWHGFDVFQLQNATLTCVYESLAAPSKTLPAISDANSAITRGTAVASPAVFGAAVLDVKTAADPVRFVADFKILALSTVNGRTNATTYLSNILTRR